MCAERVALGTAVVSEACKMGDFKALAVATDVQPAASPCGMCRQALREFCDVSDLGREGYWVDGWDKLFRVSDRNGDGEARDWNGFVCGRDTDKDFGAAVNADLHVRQGWRVRCEDAG